MRSDFPIIYTRNDLAGPLRISWSLAELAYSVYSARFGTSQSLERIAERGGFSAQEMETFVPGWRTHQQCLVGVAVSAFVETLRAFGELPRWYAIESARTDEGPWNRAPCSLVFRSRWLADAEAAWYAVSNPTRRYRVVEKSGKRWSVSLNDTVEVVLTAAGAAALAEHFAPFRGSHPEVDFEDRRAGDVWVTQLWTAMQVLGPHTRLGGSLLVARAELVLHGAPHDRADLP